MGTGGTVLNLMDWAKRLDPNGNTADVINLLSQDNEILDDMVFVQSNGPTSHRTTVITGEPSVSFRTLNSGVTPSKSTTDQIDEPMGIIETYSEIDKDLCELNGNTNAFRLSETKPFLSAINKLAVQTLIYGDAGVNPDRFNGINTRYAVGTGTSYQNSMLNAAATTGAGSGSVYSSILLVVWGQNTVHGIFPPGSNAGIVQEDKGQVTIETGATNGIGTARMEAYRTRWQWKLGLAVRDHRYIVRAANVNTGTGAGGIGSATAQNMVTVMSRMLDRIPSFGAGKAVFYMNRTLYSYLRLQALSSSNYAVSINPALDQFGNPQRGMMQFSGIPIRRLDQMLTTEAEVTF
jgi:hypothetical protein